MNKKHAPVNMAFGQLYDAVANGAEFYFMGDKVFISKQLTLVTQRATHKRLADSVNIKMVTRLVETPWTDQLDGTWENGVWCMVWDESNKPSFGKVTVFNHDLYGTYESAWTLATPLPTEFADQLEKLSRNACAPE